MSEGDGPDDDAASGAERSATGKAGGTASKSDPDAAWAAKDGPAKFAYYDNYPIDNAHGVIVGVEATPARFSEEVRAARAMLERTERTFGLRPSSLGADKARARSSRGCRPGHLTPHPGDRPTQPDPGPVQPRPVYIRWRSRRHYLPRGRNARPCGDRRPKPGQCLSRLAEAPAPFVDGAGADAHGRSHVGGMFSPIQTRDQYLSTARRQTGILMDVHSVLLCKRLFLQTSASQGWIE